MRNLTTTTEKYIMQPSLFPDEIQEQTVRKRELAPTFKPYDNKQAQMILDLEMFIPSHHVARVIDEMIEAIPESQLFAHYAGGGRSSYHPKMMLKVILYSYSQNAVAWRSCCVKISRPCGWPPCNSQISAPLMTFAAYE